MNWRNQKGAMSGGQQSAGTAILFIVVGAFFYLKSTGQLANIVQDMPEFIQNIVLGEEQAKANIAKASEEPKDDEESKETEKESGVPNYAIPAANIAAYSNFENADKVGDIEANTKLTILDYKKNENGAVTWINVRVNGLNVWIKNENLEFEF